MADELVFVSRVVRLSLLDSEGTPMGRIDDIVLVPSHRRPPRVLGFVAVVQRRRIFVNVAKVSELSNAGIRLRSGAIDLRHFQLRPGEILAADRILDRRHGTSVVNDVALRSIEAKSPTWEVAAVALGSPGPLRRRRSSRVVDWKEVAELFEAGAVAQEVASMRDMHPSDVARLLRSLPLSRRQQLAAAMDDDRLADLLEELPEDEQLRIVENIDLDRLAHIIEEMDPDDAVDLLGEMPGEQRIKLLASMDPEEARPLRRLLLYDTKTAGGLMTSEPVVLEPGTTIAEALARVREYELPPVLAAQVFVVKPPTETPTGAYLGVVGVQRLLRESPSMEVGRCLDSDSEAIDPNMPETEVARRLAQYDLLAIAVVDEGGRLLGAVTVDDIIDHMLPVDWRHGR
jgi:flagellar motility protein MotE (MotC chaperone)